MSSKTLGPQKAPLSRCGAWRQLTEHRRLWKDRRLRDLFDADEQRYSTFSLEAAGILLDYSKNWITAETRELLVTLAEERGLSGAIKALFAGEPVNTTEKRAAWHVVLRAGSAAPQAVQDTLARMRRFSKELRERQVAGATGKPITDVVSLGIGGSALGPLLAIDALAADAKTPRVHVVAAPGEALMQTLRTLAPETTLFIVQSKSFTTSETLRNAGTARHWLATHGIPAENHGHHFAAVTAAPDRAIAAGIAQERIYPMWDWVGGRYSLWSAVGLPAMIAMGADRFDDMLAGAASMDRHAGEAPPERNMPALLALIGLWNTNFFGITTRAVIPYDLGLRHLPRYLQQLEMESLGKQVTVGGKPVRWDTGNVIWGGLGIEGQHAYFQAMHLDTRPMPVDFIACCRPRDGDDDTQHFLLANCLAQSALLMRGLRSDELPGNATGREARRLAPHRSLPGNRPSNTLLLPALTPHSFGALIALYEHRTTMQAALWGINAFDQWGVEHGKSLASRLQSGFSRPTQESAGDASTRGLLRYINQHSGESNE